MDKDSDSDMELVLNDDSSDTTDIDSDFENKKLKTEDSSSPRKVVVQPKFNRCRLCRQILDDSIPIFQSERSS